MYPERGICGRVCTLTSRGTFCTLKCRNTYTFKGWHRCTRACTSPDSLHRQVAGSPGELCEQRCAEMIQSPRTSAAQIPRGERCWQQGRQRARGGRGRWRAYLQSAEQRLHSKTWPGPASLGPTHCSAWWEREPGGPGDAGGLAPLPAFRFPRGTDVMGPERCHGTDVK